MNPECSCYGKLGLNKEKQRDYKYISKDILYKDKNIPSGNKVPLEKLKKTGQKLKESPFTQSIDDVQGEYPTNYVEIVSKKKRYTDSTAGFVMFICMIFI